jgi:hypothetical protein
VTSNLGFNEPDHYLRLAKKCGLPPEAVWELYAKAGLAGVTIEEYACQRLLKLVEENSNDDGGDPA